MPTSTDVLIIYNPKSTGDSQANAEAVAASIGKLKPELAVRLEATRRATHARDIAYEAAKSGLPIIILSSSGDGGYNEVVNGVMAAGEHSQAICAVIPSGNANDHDRAVRQRPIDRMVVERRIRRIDVVRVDITASGVDPSTHYAHSYAGLGLTPEVAVELNRHSLNRWRETKLAAKTFAEFDPVAVSINGRQRLIDSLVVSNIDGMAKVLRLSQSSRIDDGKFELNVFTHGHKIQLLLKLLQGVTLGLRPAARLARLEMDIPKSTVMQLDGEVVTLPAACHLVFTCERQALQTLS